MDIFEQATRIKLRIPSSKGNLTVEQLWDMPLKVIRKDKKKDDGQNDDQNNLINFEPQFDLDTLAKIIHTELQQAAVPSFVDEQPKPPNILQLRMDIILHIINTKKREIEVKRQLQSDRGEQQILEELIERKKQESILSLTLEELQEKLDTLKQKNIT